MTTATRRVGAYDVTMLRDGMLKASTDHLVHLKGEAALAAAKAMIGSDGFDMVVNCFLLRGPNGVTLIDAGCGTSWGENFGKARLLLAELGLQPGDVDRVLVTHVHGDHVPGLWDGQEAYFPRAEMLVPERELAFFTNKDLLDTVPEARRSGFGLAAHLQQAYGDRIRAIADGPVLDGVSAVPLPGHTPGHTGYRIGSGPDGLLIWADALHLARWQPANPGLAMVYDLDPVLAETMRRAMLAEAADEQLAVTGCHLDGYFRVEREGDAFRLTPA